MNGYENVPQAVLAGSTNWTPTGLCGQSNNAIIINSKELAKDYFDYWNDLKEDTEKAEGVKKELQGSDFREENRDERPTHSVTDDRGQVCGTVRAWFSPNTEAKAKPVIKFKANLVASTNRKKGKSTKKRGRDLTPPDLKEVFDLIENAKQGVLFLAFIPGSPSIVTKLHEVYAEKAKKQQFFVRGAATSPDPAHLFKVDLFHRTMKSDARVTPIEEKEEAEKASAKVDSVAGIYEAFAGWEREIYKLGYAVIHDKIVVIDPFTDDCVVVTGSYNLGFKASYSNDENLLIIRGDRGIAEAYTAHVLDVYDHYRWRWRLQEGKKKNKQMASSEAWHALRPDDSWQDFYYTNKDFLAPEVLFWSPFEGESRPIPRRTRSRRSQS